MYIFVGLLPKLISHIKLNSQQKLTATAGAVSVAPSMCSIQVGATSCAAQVILMFTSFIIHTTEHCLVQPNQ